MQNKHQVLSDDLREIDPLCEIYVIERAFGNLFHCKLNHTDHGFVMTPNQILGYSEKRGYTVRIDNADIQKGFNDSLDDYRKRVAAEIEREIESGELSYQARHQLTLIEQRILWKQGKLPIGPNKRED